MKVAALIHKQPRAPLLQRHQIHIRVAIQVHEQRTHASAMQREAARFGFIHKTAIAAVAVQTRCLRREPAAPCALRQVQVQESIAIDIAPRSTRSHGGTDVELQVFAFGVQHVEPRACAGVDEERFASLGC